MKKKITGSVLSAGAIVLGLAAAGCGGAIETAADGWAMLGYTLLAIVLGCAALALAGLGLVAEQRKEPQKIHKVPENTVKKAACGRKAGVRETWEKYWLPVKRARQYVRLSEHWDMKHTRAISRSHSVGT